MEKRPDSSRLNDLQRRVDCNTSEKFNDGREANIFPVVSLSLRIFLPNIFTSKSTCFTWGTLLHFLKK